MPSHKCGERILIPVNRIPIKQFGVCRRRASLGELPKNGRDVGMFHCVPRGGFRDVIPTDGKIPRKSLIICEFIYLLKAWEIITDEVVIVPLRY
jgi:hypothetical protein